MHLLPHEEVLIQSLHFLNPFENRSSEVHVIDRMFSTGSGWGTDEANPKPDGTNPYSRLFEDARPNRFQRISDKNQHSLLIFQNSIRRLLGEF